MPPHSTSFRFILILSSRLRLGLSSSLFKKIHCKVKCSSLIAASNIFHVSPSAYWSISFPRLDINLSIPSWHKLDCWLWNQLRTAVSTSSLNNTERKNFLNVYTPGMWVNENLPLEEIRFYQITERSKGGGWGRTAGWGEVEEKV